MKPIVILLILITSNTFAQYNDTTHYHLTTSLAGSINSTNNSTAYLLNNSVNFGIKKKDMTLNAANTWVYGRQNNTLTNNDYSGTLFFNLYKTLPHFYYWGLANYNTSYSLKISNQLLAGAGVAYNIIDHTNVWLNLSDGILYDQSSLLALKDYHTYRNSARVSFHFNIDDTFTLDGSNFLQSSLSDSNDYIIRSATTLGFKLRKWISLTSAFSYNKMNITQSDNLIFTYGVVLDKFF